MRTIFTLLLLFIVLIVPAQNFYVTGATVHTGTGEVIENAVIVVENGRISTVSDARLVRLDMTFGPVIDAGGKQIYPGLVALNTTLGLNEIDYIKPTRDYTEIGQFTPNVRSLIAYNSDSRVIPTVKSNGVLYQQMVPYGGLISGSSSVMCLEGWNWEDAVVVVDDGVHLRWPDRFQRGGWWSDPGGLSENMQYQQDVEDIHHFLKRAASYNKDQPDKTDIVLEAMKPVFAGTANLYIHVQDARSISTAIALTDALDIPRRVLVGGRDALAVRELLTERDIPVVLTSLYRLPGQPDDEIDQWYSLPARLRDAGIRFCISFSGPSSNYEGSWEQRSLPFMAGLAAGYGLTREEALSAITRDAAQIVGAEEIGTLEPGKTASFLIVSGDLLDMRTSTVERAFVNGEEIRLDDKQKALYRKFRNKYVEEGFLTD